MDGDEDADVHGENETNTACSCSWGNPRRKRSEVWGFFVKRDKTALCKLCKNEYAYHGGTSNLRDHLTCAHLSKLHPPEGQASLDSYLSQAKCPEGRVKRIPE